MTAKKDFASLIIIFLLRCHGLWHIFNVFATKAFLKGPKAWIFGSKVFSQIRTVWVGENCYFIIIMEVTNIAQQFSTLLPTTLKNLNSISPDL
jgi:hypothetical protein